MLKTKLEQLSDEAFIQIVQLNVSRGDISKLLGYKGMSSALSKKLTERINLLAIDITHFIKGGEKSRKHKKLHKNCPVCNKAFITDVKENKVTCSQPCANTFFRSGSNHPQWNKNSYRNICFSVYPYKCLLCAWNKILDVHHVNSIKKDNSKKNLVPLCPNHHALTRTTKHKDEIDKDIKKAIELHMKIFPEKFK